ncbi:MAG: hypothetical protein LBJ81_01760 [Puniceicoccales bacterium]|nr:hypothetical protein [Puniceicoccales bacterium]
MDWEGSRYVDDRCSLFQRESGVLLDIPSLLGSGNNFFVKFRVPENRCLERKIL